MDKMIELEALKTIREGYIAENQHRLACGNSPAYGDEHFQDIADHMRALRSSQQGVQGGRVETCRICVKQNKSSLYC